MNWTFAQRCPCDHFSHVSSTYPYPRVVLGASIGSTGLTADFLKKATNDWGIGPGISWELNQIGPRARIAAASATPKARFVHFDGVVLASLRDVESALNVYTQDLERQKSLTAARDEAASAVADARRLQADRRSGSLATLDAERILASSESAVAALRAQIAQDQVAPYLALGGGWEMEGAAPSSDLGLLSTSEYRSHNRSECKH
jgi:multidrug efflux system outer membrane protein